MKNPIELELTSNGDEVKVDLADGQALYIKSGKSKIVRYDYRDFKYHLLDCRCQLCQP